MKRVTALTVLVICLASWLNVSSVNRYFGDQINPKPKYTVEDAPFTGDPDYPVLVNKQVNYWIVNCSVSEATTVEVDRVLENLNADHIAQTMILCLNQTVSQPTSYAMRFLRYMGLGLPDGQRKDNGLVFLVLQSKDKLDVHYAVGLGLPALTAQGLSPLNRVGEDTFAETKSLDKAVLSMASSLDTYARAKYQPLNPVAPQYGAVAQQSSDELPPGTIWLGLAILFWLILVTETLFSFGALFGSHKSYSLMSWPLYLVRWSLELALTAKFSGSSSSSRSGSGGGGTLRGN